MNLQVKKRQQLDIKRKKNLVKKEIVPSSWSFLSFIRTENDIKHSRRLFRNQFLATLSES